MFMNKNIWKWEAFARVMFALIAILPGGVMAQGIVLANTYDGTNYYGGSYTIGADAGYTYEVGARFTVAGSGDFTLSRIIMSIYVSSFFGGTPNPSNYQVSLVSDNGNQPTGDLVGAFTPAGVSRTGANLVYDIAGLVHGGGTYWLLFSPIAPDNGNLEWNVGWPPYNVGMGYVASRWSASGLPTGAWSISTGVSTIQPAFVLEGAAVVPEPKSFMVFGIGLLGLIIRGCLCRKRLT